MDFKQQHLFGVELYHTTYRNFVADGGYPEQLRVPRTEREYPEGGRRAWLTIVGAWLVLFSSIGYLQSFGVYQDYYVRLYLTNHTSSQISWIGSVQFMIPHFLGLLSGKLFDEGFFHLLQISGAIIYSFSLFMLSLSKPGQYYQIFLAQGLGMGLGLGFIFVPSVTIATHYFQRRKGLAVGVAMSGSGVGSICFPILLNRLLRTHTFGDSVRASAYLVFGCLIVGNLLMRTRPSHIAKDPPNIKEFFSEWAFHLTALSSILVGFGIIFPIFYIQLYAVLHNIDSNLAFYSLAILSTGGTVGRVVSNCFSDVLGPFNMVVFSTLGTAISIFLMFTIRSNASLIIISLIYGFFAGSYLSTSVSAMASLAKRPSDIGAKTGLILALTSFAFMGSTPISGALLTSEFHWERPIVFAGVFVFISAFAYFAVTQVLRKERGTWKV